MGMRDEGRRCNRGVTGGAARRWYRDQDDSDERPRERVPPMPDQRHPDIPPRLRRLMPLLAAGRSNEEIADELALAPHSVENYVSDLMHLLGARDRVALVLLCVGAERRGEP